MLQLVLWVVLLIHKLELEGKREILDNTYKLAEKKEKTPDRLVELKTYQWNQVVQF